MSRPPLRLFRIAAIRFLNPAPLMWDFEHEPLRRKLLTRYAIDATTPAECARRLASGAADIGLVPVAAYTSVPDLRIVPGCAIASLARVRSILLVVRPAGGVTAVRRVAADTSSMTSNTYARILFARFWKTPVEFLPHAPDLEAMLRAADAAVLIGDPALVALEEREARERRTGEKLLYLDLAEEWRRATGLPWISAFWAAREMAFAETGLPAAEVAADFERSRDHGLEHIGDLAREWAGRIRGEAGRAVTEETIRSYLTENIHYVLDEPCVEGLRAFYRYAAECAALPAAPTLKFL